MSDIVEIAEKRSTRDIILDAAETIVADEGSGRLTIDAVVRKSGFSKGGVLYNFPSKAALIEGMVERMACSIREDALHAADEAEKTDCAVLMALLENILNKDEEKMRVRMGLLAALAEQPELIGTVRKNIEQIKEQVAAHTSDIEMAYLMFLAADGMRLSRMMGLEILTLEERERVEKRMLKITKEISR